MANIVLFANNDQTTLAGAITSVALTANLSPGSGVLFPSPVTGQYFPMTFVDAATGLLREIVYVTGVTGDVITMTRAQEGTTALAWNAGDIAANLLTAGSMNLMAQTPQIQANANTYAADTGTANSYAVALSPASPVPKTGAIVYFKALNANTGASTLALNGSTGYALNAGPGGALVPNAIAAGSFCAAQFNGTTFNLLFATGGIGQTVTPPAGDSSTSVATTAWANNLLNGQTNIALTNANVTLTAAQYGQYILALTGALTGNVVIFLPATTATWQVRNSTTGAFSVTFAVVGTPGSVFVVPNTVGANTATIYSDGTNVVNGNTVSSAIAIEPIQQISASAASGAMTFGIAATTLQFRSATGNSGVISTVNFSALSLVAPSGSTFGQPATNQGMFVLAVLYNGGSPALAVASIAGGLDMSETGTITSTAISTGSTSNAVWYSTAAVTASPYRIVGYILATQATLGTWVNPTFVQGMGGESLAALMSYGYGQSYSTFSPVSGTTYYNVKPRTGTLVIYIQGGTIPGVYVNGSQVTAIADVTGQGSSATVPLPPYCSFSLTITNAGVSSIYSLLT
jgi:hypothetical protein